MTEAYDVAIVGGGMVGASLAVALQPLGLAVALIESVPHASAAQPSFDERTTALSNGSRRILETIGVWPGVESAATAIRRIHVSDRGRFGFARIDAAELGLAAIGYVVPNRALGAALWARIGADARMRVFCPATLEQVRPGTNAVELRVSEPGRAPAEISARLVVAADGVHSAVRTAVGVTAETRDYEQSAVITAVLPQRFHEHIAYERFTESGPLALLPLADGRCTLVLTVRRADLEDVLAADDAAFLAMVEERFGTRLGRFLKVGARVAYPLALTRAMRTSAQRCVILGNAAQSLHPVAGMGFNLGLRDVASLAEVLADARGEGRTDCGAPAGLEAYEAWRRRDRRAVIAFTDLLVRAFSNPLSIVRGARNFGLLAFDLLPPAKSALSRLSTGAGGRVPKLARGVPLA
ncbi:MAG: 2-octaprenyl-6-methoxyphenyl hydroxylase [Gammaproteobacteria bacterium]|nr:2-octaprenyl-6-methoxyphenyl hydroxylase [Gammaproteobacteria bacterium]